MLIKLYKYFVYVTISAKILKKRCRAHFKAKERQKTKQSFVYFV